jgi:hypothetical protein
MDGEKPNGGPSLAQWKFGANRMTTAEAGNHVSATAPPKPRPKVLKASKPAPSTKPWHEQSIAERYGLHPPKMMPVNLNKQIRDALRYLEAYQDRECSWDEVATNAIPPWYDTTEGGDLYNALVDNPRVEATSTGFRYLSQFGIRDKASLLEHIRACPTGVRSIDFKDSYMTAVEDADKLHAEGAVYKLYNAEFKMDVFFPVPDRPTTASADLVDFYLRTELPSDPKDLAAGVEKHGMRSALAYAKTDRKPLGMMKQEKTKKKRKTNLRHMTNTHLAHLLDGQFTSID